jgi:hypothetical protein
MTDKLTVETQQPMYILTKKEFGFNPTDIVDTKNVNYIRSHGKHQHLFKVTVADKDYHVWTHAFPYTKHDNKHIIPMPRGCITINGLKYNFLCIYYSF